jgi:hypothetical protein
MARIRRVCEAKYHIVDTLPSIRRNYFIKVELAKDVEEFLQEQVREHVCADPSQLVNDSIRSLRDQRKKPFEVTEELETWLLKSAEGMLVRLLMPILIASAPDSVPIPRVNERLQVGRVYC